MGIDARFRVAYPGFSLDVDLALPGQGVTAVFGRSGSGKTTFLRCVAGLEKAAGGRLEVNGEIWQGDGVWLPVERRPIGYVFQEANLFPHLSVEKNLRYGMKRTGRAAASAMGQAAELLGIGHLLERMPERLSGGERQRVAIARALLAGPRLLLLDEPLAALDQERKSEILPYLERLHDELEIPVLYVSHSPDEVARLADHLVVLDAGRVTASGPIGEVLAQIDLPIRLGEDAGVVLEAIVAERQEAWHLARVEFAGGSLWVRDKGIPPGHRVRIRILARDVSIAREKLSGTSLLNILSAKVLGMGDEVHPAVALMRLAVGPSSIVARLTRRSAAALELCPGNAVWIQIKAVALIT